MTWRGVTLKYLIIVHARLLIWNQKFVCLHAIEYLHAYSKYRDLLYTECIIKISTLWKGHNFAKAVLRTKVMKSKSVQQLFLHKCATSWVIIWPLAFVVTFIVKLLSFQNYALKKSSSICNKEFCLPTRLLSDFLHLHAYSFFKFCSPTLLFNPTRLLDT